MLIPTFYQFQPNGHSESYSEVGFISLAKCIVRVEQEILEYFSS